MKTYKLINDKIFFILILFTSILLVVMVIAASWQVFTRFILNYPSTWTESLIVTLMIYFGVFGAVVDYRERLHIGIKFFINLFNPRIKGIIYFFIDVFLGIFAVFLIIYGFILTVDTMGHNLPGLNIPVGLSYIAIPLSGIFFLVFIVEKIILDITNHKKDK